MIVHCSRRKEERFSSSTGLGRGATKPHVAFLLTSRPAPASKPPCSSTTTNNPIHQQKVQPQVFRKQIKIRNPILFAQTLTVFNALDQILEVEASLVLAERFQGWDFHHGAAKATENGPRSPSRCTETGPRGFATSRWQHVAPNAGSYGVYTTVTGLGRCYPKP